MHLSIKILLNLCRFYVQNVPDYQNILNSMWLAHVIRHIYSTIYMATSKLAHSSYIT
jgi:hypothetical protein